MKIQKHTKLNQNSGFRNENCNVWDTVQLLSEAQQELVMIKHKLKTQTNHTLLNKKDEIEHILNDFYSKLLNLKYMAE